MFCQEKMVTTKTTLNGSIDAVWYCLDIWGRIYLCIGLVSLFVVALLVVGFVMDKEDVDSRDA